MTDAIDRMLECKKTDRVFPETDTSVSASMEKIDNGESGYQPASFGVRREYELRLRVGVSFAANDTEYPHKEKTAIKQLKYELYKDIIGDIYEAKNVTNDVKTKKILDRVLDKMTGDL